MAPAPKTRLVVSHTTPDLILPSELPLTEEAHGLVSDLMTLTKARLSLLVVVTTFVGACMASSGPIAWLRLLNAIIGTSLAAAAAAVLNQVAEARVDRLMERTRHRPIPAGRIKRRTRSLARDRSRRCRLCAARPYG